MPKRKLFVAIGILVFDYEFFIGGLSHVILCGTRINRHDICFTGLYIPVVYYTCRIFLQSWVWITLLVTIYPACGGLTSSVRGC